MPNASPRVAVPVALVVLPCAAIAQEPPVRFVLKNPPIVRVAVTDLPGFVSAAQSTKLGRMLADPDVFDTFAGGVERFWNEPRRWADATRALEALDANRVDEDELVQRELWTLDWRTLKSAALVATQKDGSAAGAFQTTMLFEPTAGAEADLTQRFERLADAVWTKLGEATPAATTTIDGFPARVTAKAKSHDQDEPMEAVGAWYLHLPGQFAAGDGAPTDAGHCRATAAEPPAVAVEVDVAAYLAFLQSFLGEPPFGKTLRALGVADRCRLAWRVAPKAALLQDEITLELGKLGGLFAALVHATAPLVDQPLPEGALLQLHCAFDVRELIAVVDQLLDDEGLPTLTKLGVAGDLDKAWTGGIALGVCAPTGSLVPRVFLSLGVVDAEALDRLLAKLVEATGLEKREVVFDEQKCFQLKIPDAPPALAPTWCVQGNTLHVAESGVGMRALLKAVAAKAPRLLDVGDTPRPDGQGAIVPGFDLRFDAAAMYAAYRDTWLPPLELVTSAAARGIGGSPLLQRNDLPDARTAAEHLGRGRGVLRHTPDRLVLTTNGATGGPLLTALLFTLGPTLSPNLVWSWQWSTNSTWEQVKTVKLERTHAAIEAFRNRTGKRPESLADLIGVELPDATMLHVEGDATTEPLVRDGKEIGRTSFRYYRDGIEVAPERERVKVHLVAITAGQWTRLAVGIDGTVHEGFGDFAHTKIDDLERQR